MELLGKYTTNGIQITGQTGHFLERVFGTMIDPKTGLPRSGVALVVDVILRANDSVVHVLRYDGRKNKRR